MKAYYKNILRTISNNKRRYFTMIIIVALGVAFFAGLRSTSPNMNLTLNTYLNNQKMFDVRILTSLGLDKQDIEKIISFEKIDSYYPSYFTDQYATVNDQSYLTRFHSYNKKQIMNNLVLVHGKLPEKDNECVVSELFLEMVKLNIGDTIKVSSADDTNLFETLKYDEYIIVGSVNSPLYLTTFMESSTKGNGSLNTYMYLLEDAFVMDYYSELFLTFNSLNNLFRFSDEYIDIRDNYVDELQIMTDQTVANKLINTTNDISNEINDAEKKLLDAQNEIAEAQKQILDNEILLLDAQKQLDQALIQYNDGLKALEESDVQNQLNDAKKQLNNGFNEINNNLANVNNGFNEITKQKDQLVLLTNVLDYETLINNYNTLPSDIKLAIDSITQTETELNQNKLILETKLNELEIKQQELDQQIIIFNNQKAQLDNAFKEIEINQQEITNNFNQLEIAKQELLDAQTTFEKEKIDAQIKIDDAKKLIDDLEAKAYVLGLNMNPGFVMFEQDSSRIEAISKVFPLIFFLVAALVTMTNMLRIIEDDRMSIGVLKALGYSRMAILAKYVIYAISISIFGSVLGVLIGFWLFPLVIFDFGYKIMYQVPNIITPIRLDVSFLALLVALICVLIPTIIVCYKELFSTPANLLRPKAPVSGKRVVLELLPIIWNRLNFSAKVTARNILRYKKRFFMSVIGIAGCSALLITGFGVSDSIKPLVTKQFEEIFLYNYQVEINNNKDHLLENILTEKTDDFIYIYQTNYTIFNEEESISISAIIPETKELLNNFINLTYHNKSLNLNDNSVIISEKIAKKMNYSIGDIIYFKDANYNEFEVTLLAITENYADHYMYMSKDLYESLFDTDIQYNTILGISDNKDFANEILSLDMVNGLSFNDTISETFGEMINALNIVTVILIIAAGALAFVVLFSLTSINIDERARELATLKVLGLYHKETANYIFRENMVLTIIGASIGIIFGHFLHQYVITTVETEQLLFIKQIRTISYLYSTILTFVFAIIVNMIMNKSIKQIDMVESLKSIE